MPFELLQLASSRSMLRLQSACFLRWLYLIYDLAVAPQIEVAKRVICLRR